MNKQKKKLPIVILKSLEKFVTLKGEKFEIIEPDNLLLKVVEKDDDTVFYFNIEQFKLVNGGYQFYMSRKPQNENNQGEYKSWIPIAHLEKQFETWLKLIEQYETINSFYDDPIAKAFSDEYFTDFEIIDEDADIAPFKIKQILILDKYLEYIEQSIDNYKTEENEKSIENIKQDIYSLRKNLTSKSKVYIIRGLSNIWGKLTKLGTKFITDFTSEAKREVVERSVKGLIDLVIETGGNLLP